MNNRKLRLVPLAFYFDAESDGQELYREKVKKAREAHALVDKQGNQIDPSDLRNTEGYIELDTYEFYILARLDFLKTRAIENPSFDNLKEYELVSASSFYDRHGLIRWLAGIVEERYQKGTLDWKYIEYYRAAELNFEVICTHLLSSQALLFDYVGKSVKEDTSGN